MCGAAERLGMNAVQGRQVVPWTDRCNVAGSIVQQRAKGWIAAAVPELSRSRK